MAGLAPPSDPVCGANNNHPPLTVSYQTAFNYDKEIRVVHREQVANPAPLGLAAFALTTALLQGGNTAITEGSTRYLVYSFALFFGGLAQLLAGMWEFKRQNTFGATAFTSYGAFWMSFAIFGILVSAGIFQPAHDGEKASAGIEWFELFKPKPHPVLLLLRMLHRRCPAGAAASPCFSFERTRSAASLHYIFP